MRLTLAKLSPVLLVVALSFPAWKALLPSGYFSMHDDQQVVRLFEMHKALVAGQFPVRWVEGLGFGYGYPLFNFYPPLVYYLGEVISIVLLTGFVDSIKVVWIVALAGSGLAMYFLAKELFGRIGGVVSAMFYVFAPYHAIDAYIRGALAELFSFVWLPLVLLTSYKFVRTGYKKYSVLTSICLGLLMMTHNLIFLPFVGIFICWMAFMYFMYGDRSNKLFIIYHLSFILLLAFGLSAFFWLPALAEKKDTLVDEILIKNLASYKLHYVCPEQLWDSPWGFGGSVSGCLDGVSFKLGRLHWLAVIVALGLIIVSAVRRIKKHLGLGLVIVGLLAFSLFMTTSLSSFVWNQFSWLWYLQFPWRFLEFGVLFSALLAGMTAVFLPYRKINLIIGIGLVAAVIAVNAKYFRPQVFDSGATDATETSDYHIRWEVSSTSFEYLPRGVATRITDLGVVWVDITDERIAREKYKIVQGSFFPVETRFSPDRFRLVGDAVGDTVIQFQITHFPGWEITVNDRQVKLSDDNPYKLLTITLPEGRAVIAGRFADTAVRRAGNLVSLVFIVGLGATYVARRIKK